MQDSFSNNLQSATNLTLGSVSRSLNDSISPTNLDDYYSFNLSYNSRFGVSLQGMSANLDLQLIQDLNSNGQVDTREVLNYSNQLGTTPDSINLVLPSGKYYLHVYANVPGISSNYKLDLSNNSLAAADYVDASPAKSYFGINVTRTFYNSDGFGLYQSQYGTYLMYGSIADYYHNNYAKNPESERGLLDIFSGLGAPVSPITKQADGSLQMEFEGGTLTSKNGTVTPSYSHKGSDRFDLVGQGAPNKDELQWKADYSWFDSRFEHNHVGQPTGSVRRLANGWVQEFTGNTTGAGDSVFLLKDGQTAIGGTERYVNDRGQSIEVPKGGPYRIHGGILDLYRLTGGYESTTSQLGFPTQSLERYDYKGYKVYQAFEKGFIGITASGIVIQDGQGKSIPLVGLNGSQIQNSYVDTFKRNGSGAVLGSPSNSPHTVKSLNNPSYSGSFQDFSGGSDQVGAIMQAQGALQAYWVGGEFWNTYLAAQGINGILGYATSDRYQTDTTSIRWRQDFQGGSIFKSEQGTFTISGGIYAKYQSLGGNISFLGIPTSKELAIGDGWIQQNFAGGYILYKDGVNTTAYDVKAIDTLPNTGRGSTGTWSVQYWNNDTQTGNPILSGTAPAGELRFAAGVGAPVGTRGIGENHFSARWTTTSNFEGGFYDFVSQADDGVRVYVDGIKVVDRWQNQTFVPNDGYVLIPKGLHTVRVDYFENEGSAANYLRWEPVGQRQGWQGQVLAVGANGSDFSTSHLEAFKRIGSAAFAGTPDNAVHLLGNGFVQDFTGGTEGRGIIMKSNASPTAFWVGGDIWNKYYNAGNLDVLGYPTSDRIALPGGWKQDFERGSIVKSDRGTFAITSSVWSKYQAFGGQSSFLGLPVGDAVNTGSGWYRQTFEGGYIEYKDGQPTIAYDTTATRNLPADSGHGSNFTWNIAFWNNMNFQGEAAATMDVAAGELRFASGLGAPIGTRGIAEDHFSARWATTSYFDGGIYNFVSRADDNVRLYLDDNLLIDGWQFSANERTKTTLVNQGLHNVRVEYAEDGGATYNTLRWDQVAGLDQWIGSFYNNPTLQGTPVGYISAGKDFLNKVLSRDTCKNLQDGLESVAVYTF